MLLPGIIILAACSSPGTRTIRQHAKAVRESPGDSVTIHTAVAAVWQVLEEEYPQATYSRSSTFGELLEQWPRALQEGRPFLVAFAPDTVVSQNNNWSWMTQFRELAGHRVSMETMTPNIYTPSGEMYYFPEGQNDMTGTVTVMPFGRGSYDWWCSGDFNGSHVELHFGNGAATSYTVFHNPSAASLPPDEMPPPPSQDE
jgi:hypothetical protein